MLSFQKNEFMMTIPLCWACSWRTLRNLVVSYPNFFHIQYPKIWIVFLFSQKYHHWFGREILQLKNFLSSVRVKIFHQGSCLKPVNIHHFGNCSWMYIFIGRIQGGHKNSQHDIDNSQAHIQIAHAIHVDMCMENSLNVLLTDANYLVGTLHTRVSVVLQYRN